MKKLIIALCCYIFSCHGYEYRLQQTHPADRYAQEHAYKIVPTSVEQTTHTVNQSNIVQESLEAIASSVQGVISNSIEIGAHVIERFAVKQKLQEARLTLSTLEQLTEKPSLERKGIINQALITIAQHDEDINSLTYYISFVQRQGFKTDKETATQLSCLLQQKQKITDEENKRLTNAQEDRIKKEFEVLATLKAQINAEKNKITEAEDILRIWNKDLAPKENSTNPLITVDEKGNVLYDGLRPV
jgi:hypothetical protein